MIGLRWRVKVTAMKRTTVMIPDQIAELLDAERRRRDVSSALVIREALERYLLEPSKPRVLKIAALGDSGVSDTSARMEEILADDWSGEQAYRSIVFGEDPHDAAAGSAMAAEARERYD